MTVRELYDRLQGLFEELDEMQTARPEIKNSLYTAQTKIGGAIQAIALYKDERKPVYLSKRLAEPGE